MQNKIFLLLGSNIEPRYDFLTKAKEAISNSVGSIITNSQIYETEPVGFEANQSFLNQVIIVSSNLSAQSTLNIILSIELDLGRKRVNAGYSSRTIDIDILFFNNEIIKTNSLIVPHPRINERKFTLEPLAEIAPNFINPVHKISNKKMLEVTLDKSSVKIYKHLLI